MAFLYFIPPHAPQRYTTHRRQITAKRGEPILYTTRRHQNPLGENYTTRLTVARREAHRLMHSTHCNSAMSSAQVQSTTQRHYLYPVNLLDITLLFAILTT